ncbi:MAG: hypothetical protein HYU57_00165 [Micavibrio aeruginosavorus]|nr:hypothetical protein [Micavibrio aeruginosavorus]
MFSRKNKNPPGKLRRAFAAAAAVVLAAQFGASTLIGMATDRTAEEAARLGLEEARLRSIAKAAFNTHYPEDKAAYLVPMLQGFFDIGAEMRNENAFARKRDGDYEFYGIALKHPFFGYNGFFDRMTLHAASKLSQCNIVVSSDAMQIDKVKRLFTGLDPRQVANFPGTIKDYQTIFLLHELHHCSQTPSADTASQETGADIASLDDYLRHGGNRDVARSVMYGRVLLAAMAHTFSATAEGGEHAYIMGPILNHRFFGGPAMTQEESRRAHRDAAAILARIDQPRHPIDRSTPGMIYALAGKALAEIKDIHPQTLAVLRLQREAFEFFMRPQGPAPAGAATPSV